VTEKSMSRHVIVCGLDGVGVRTVEQLHLSGVPVVAVEPAPDARLADQLAGWGVSLQVGSPQLRSVLLGAGLMDAEAVVCVEGGDLETLATALLARELRPDVRIVVRLSNAAVGSAVAELTGEGSVLDVAGLSAPAFVEDSLRRTAHPIDLGGESFIAVTAPAAASGTLRSIYGDLAPLAVASDGGETLICPGRDKEVKAGDSVTVVGTRAQFDDAGVVIPEVSSNPAGRRTRPLPRWARVSIAFARDADRALWYVVGALCAVVVLSSAVLHAIYKPPGGGTLSWGQALYFSIETAATVGYGDFSFAAQSAPVRAFGIGLIVLGVLLESTTFALLTNVLVSRNLEASLGRQQATALADHVVIIGLGSVGLRVLEGLLAEGREVVVLERDEHNRYLGRARALGVPVVIGDATLRQTLVSVNIHSASAIAVLTSSDLTNIETGLAVREALGDRWPAVPVVLRVFDRTLARTVKDSFGFRHVRSTSVLAAPWFVGAALGLDVLGTFGVADQPFLVGRLTIARGGGLDGLSMQELSARTRVLAIGRANGILEHPPRRGTRFFGGDQAYLVGPYEELLAVLRRDQGLGDRAAVS